MADQLGSQIVSTEKKGMLQKKAQQNGAYMTITWFD